MSTAADHTHTFDPQGPAEPVYAPRAETLTPAPGKPAEAPQRTVTIGSGEVHIERPTGLKASRAIAIMRALSRAMPELASQLARFRADYERDNVIELDRVQAKLRFPPRPMTSNGQPVVTEDGEPVMVPSPVDRLTEEDWQAAGDVYKIAASPSTEEVIVAMFGPALEVAEENVYRLLALFCIPNTELKAARKSGGLEALLDERAEALLEDGYADELLELAVVIGENVDHHFTRKVSALGDRLGNALRLVGIDRPTSPAVSTTTPPDSRPNSSTATPASTADGDPTPSSTPPMTSSSPSAPSASATPRTEPSPSTISE